MDSNRRRDGIFISYRREETAAYAGRIFDRLSGHFGEDRVFMDVDSIAIGMDFTKAIVEAVSGCDILLALIGRDWPTITDSRGRKRLDNPEDFVRIEIEAALQRDIRVVPVLVDGASLPYADDLPPSLQPLTRRQALELSHTGFRSEIARLIAAAEEVFKAQPDRLRPKDPQAARGTPDLAQEPSTQDDSQRANTFMREAVKCSSDEKYDLAIGYYTDALGLLPDNPEILIQRGDAYWYAGLADQAISDFDHALRYQTASAEMLSSRGQALAEAGRFTEAVADLEKAILQANNAGLAFTAAYARSGLGLAYGGLGRFDQALIEFDTSLRQAPGNAWVYFNRGLTYERMGQYRKALTEFEQALNYKSPPLTQGQFKITFRDPGYAR